MILEKLKLANFMCYRQVALDFTGLHVACLAGENGAGKSSLLDAITWAVWGRSRAKRDDELITLGESEMTVEFTFGLSATTYRILRRRKAGKRSRSLLDFQVFDESDAHWHSLAENRIRDTQEKIERILRLDYDTFVNSAFLRQGRADEFTTKTAAERKRVLGDILGLDRWAEYEDRTKEKIRFLETEAELLDLRLQEIDTELARRESYETEAEEAQAAVRELATALEAVQLAYQDIEGARAELRHVEARVQESEARIEQLKRDLGSLVDERVSREARLKTYQDLMSEAGAIEAGYATYRQAVRQEENLRAKLDQSAELEERRVALEKEIAEVERGLQTERAVLARRIAELESRRPGQALLAEYEEVQAQVAHLTQLADSREAARQDLVHIAEEQANLRAQNEVLRVEMKTLKERIELLERAGAECPLCDQPLTEEHRLGLLAQYQAEGQTSGDGFRANQAAVDALEERTQALKEQIAESDELLRDVPVVQRKQAALAERLEQGQQASQQLEIARQELAELEQRLTRSEYALDLRAQLAEVLAQGEALGYDTQAHEAARQAVAAGVAFAERKAQLDVARTSTQDEETALGRLEESERRIDGQMKEEAARLADLGRDGDALRARLKDGPRIEAELNRVRGEEAAARQRLGAAHQRLEACKALEKQREEKENRQGQLAAEIAIYNDLRTAFSVRGVPAMIIEAAVPEIEAEANQLLARMTGGRMHVRFDTQRETLAGEVRETLEIKIADELGTRPYENYSGGEQFRVNFAIRIALSKLLARRAGAQLQTLVIDEGFGTQDALGRERLVDAINVIQDDFAQVLVITHIEELKDAFPARIEVTKTEHGSTATIL